MASFTSATFLGLGALLNDTIGMLRMYWRPFILCAVAVLVPVGLLDAALGQLMPSAPPTAALGDADTPAFDGGSPANILSGAWMLGGASFVVLMVVVYPLLDGVLVRMSSQAIRGEPIHLRNDLHYAARRWLRIVLARLLLVGPALLALVAPFGCVMGVGLGAQSLGSSPADGPSSAVIGLLLLLVPATLVVVLAIIMLAVRFGFVTQAIIIEDQGAVAAIRRSWELTRGHMWQLIGYAIVLFLVVFLPVGIIVGVLETVLPLLETLNIDAWMTTPFGAIATTLIFSGLRAEQERYRGHWSPVLPAT